jgi:hypothetical protein
MIKLIGQFVFRPKCFHLVNMFCQRTIPMNLLLTKENAGFNCNVHSAMGLPIKHEKYSLLRLQIPNCIISALRMAVKIQVVLHTDAEIVKKSYGNPTPTG